MKANDENCQRKLQRWRFGRMRAKVSYFPASFSVALSLASSDSHNSGVLPLANTFPLAWPLESVRHCLRRAPKPGHLFLPSAVLPEVELVDTTSFGSSKGFDNFDFPTHSTDSQLSAEISSYFSSVFNEYSPQIATSTASPQATTTPPILSGSAKDPEKRWTVHKCRDIQSHDLRHRYRL
jgi:hypothetical protein